MIDRHLALIVEALSGVDEAARRRIAALLVIPADAAARQRQRDEVLRDLVPLYEAASAHKTAVKIAAALDRYLAGHWKSDREQSLLPYASTSIERIFLHRVARLNLGKSITSRQILRILENDHAKSCDISGIEMSQ